MSQAFSSGLSQKLGALFQVIVEEAGANPNFALKLEAALCEVAVEVRPAPTPEPVEEEEINEPTIEVTFDPLAVHLEAALMNGMESELRIYLSRLSLAQLEEIVTVQRLPAAQSLAEKIAEAPDVATAVDLLMDSAIEKVRGRVSAAS